MKFLMVIVNEEYQKKISDIFHHHECSATMIASTGDFLEYGETIFLLAIEETRLTSVLNDIEKEMGAFQLAKDITMSSTQKSSHTRLSAYCMDIHQFLKVGGGHLLHDHEKDNRTRLQAAKSEE